MDSERNENRLPREKHLPFPPSISQSRSLLSFVQRAFICHSLAPHHSCSFLLRSCRMGHRGWGRDLPSILQGVAEVAVLIGDLLHT